MNEKLKIKKREWYLKNKERISEKGKINRIKNKEKIAEMRKKNRELNKDKIRKQKQIYREKYKDKIREKKKQQYINNRDIIKARSKKRYENKKEEVGKTNYLWYQNNVKRAWCSNTRCQHKKDGYIIEFSTKELYDKIKDIENCEICNNKLDWTRGNKQTVKRNSPSLDRKENEVIMKLNNVHVVCHRCNATKRDRNMKEFIEYCKEIYLKNKDKYAIE